MASKPYSLYPRKRTHGKPVYYCRFRLPSGAWGSGKSTGETRPDRAEAWAIEYLQKHGGRVGTGDSVTLGEYGKAFFAYDGPWALDLRAGGKRVSTRQCYEKQHKVDAYIVPTLGAKTRLRDIDRTRVKHLRNTLYQANYAGSTINKALSALGAMLDRAEEEGIIARAPRIDWAGKLTKHERGCLTVAEARELFARPWPDLRALAGNALAASTALRQGEVLALRVSAIRDGYAYIDRGWNYAERRENETTKTGRRRRVPLSREVERAIGQLIEANPWRGDGADPFVFFAEKGPGYPMDAVILRRTLYRMLAEIGIDDAERRARGIDFHSWRHFANSLYLNGGISPIKTRAVTGHETEDMQTHYYHVDDMADVRALQNSLFASDSPT